MSTPDSDPRRALLLELLGVALEAVDGRRLVREALAADDAGPASVISIGKAASAMTAGAIDALGPRLQRALVVEPAGYSDGAITRDPRVSLVHGGHPLPDAGSLAAGEALARFAQQTPAGQQVWLLVSGGASAVLELPLPGVGLEDLRRLSAWGLASGVPVEELNAMRAALSRVKGGGLLALFAHARPAGLVISDVPGDDPAIVGSGLLAPLAVRPVSDGWPGWLRRLASAAGPRAAPANCEVSVIGRLEDAMAAAEREAERRAIGCRREPARLSGDAAQAARQVCAALAQQREPLLVCGGETVVRLPPQPGRGGRCQHLALAAAIEFAGRDDRLLLAAGTDGRDGSGDAAGAIVDGGTVARAAVAGHDAARSLAAADSGSLLEASGDLLDTGPTGTNVCDLVFALATPPAGAALR